MTAARHPGRVARALVAAAAVALAVRAGSAPAGLGPGRGRVVGDVAAAIGGSNVCRRLPVSLAPDAASGFTEELARQLPPRVGIDALLSVSNLLVFSSDVDFRAQGRVFRDEDLVAYHVVSGVMTVFLDGRLAGIPASADIDAACWGAAAGELLLSFDAPVRLPGGVQARAADIVSLRGGAFALAHSREALGVPPGADLDALVHDGGSLWFSLDVTARNPLAAGGAAGRNRDAWKWTAGQHVSVAEPVAFDNLPQHVNLVGLDAPVDSDGDWLSDYEELTGRDEAATTLPGTAIPVAPLGVLSDPARRDTDGDGQSDGAEPLAGTHPLNPDDALRIVACTRSGNLCWLTWASVPGKRYELRAVRDLSWTFDEAPGRIDAAPAGNRTTVAVPWVEQMFLRVYLDCGAQ